MISHQISRFIKITLICLLIPLSGLSDHLHAAEDQQSKVKSEYRFLVLGDSLSAAYGLMQAEGWVKLLQDMWQNNNQGIAVINAAVSGETTDGGLARLPRLIEQHSPTHILIELGGNDGLQGHSVKKMKANLNDMVAMAKAAGIEVYIQDMQIPTNYGRRYNKLFSDSFSSVASENDIILVPFFLEDIALDKSLMQRDGIHPNADAQPQIAQFMYNALTPMIVD